MRVVCGSCRHLMYYIDEATNTRVYTLKVCGGAQPLCHVVGGLGGASPAQRLIVCMRCACAVFLQFCRRHRPLARSRSRLTLVRCRRVCADTVAVSRDGPVLLAFTRAVFLAQDVFFKYGLCVLSWSIFLVHGLLAVV